MKLSTLIARLQEVQAEHGDAVIEDIFSSLPTLRLNILKRDGGGDGRWVYVDMQEREATDEDQ